MNRPITKQPDGEPGSVVVVVVLVAVVVVTVELVELDELDVDVEVVVGTTQNPSVVAFFTVNFLASFCVMMLPGPRSTW